VVTPLAPATSVWMACPAGPWAAYSSRRILVASASSSTLEETDLKYSQPGAEVKHGDIVILTEEAGENATHITGVFAPEPEQRYEVVKDADIIWSLAAAGIEVLSQSLMERLKGKKIVVDINLVPPYGIEGLKPKHDNEEIYPEIFGIGALALGRLKSNSEGQILKEAANTKGLKIFDYNYAFEVAKNLLKK